MQVPGWQGAQGLQRMAGACSAQPEGGLGGREGLRPPDPRTPAARPLPILRGPPRPEWKTTVNVQWIPATVGPVTRPLPTLRPLNPRAAHGRTREP